MADIPQYPMMFSSDQWLNKFSPLSGKPIPFPASYQGTPTDAHGNPIQSYLDTQAAHDAWAASNPAQAAPVTLDTSPVSGNPAPVGTPLNPMGDWSVLAPDLGMGAQTQANYANALGLPGSQYNGYTKAPWAAQTGTGTGTGTAQPATAAATNPYDMNQAYKNALANPGHVTTPGATVPQSALPSDQSGVLQQFLANWKQGGGQTKGAGNYNNQSFFSGLQGGMPAAPAASAAPAPAPSSGLAAGASVPWDTLPPWLRGQV